MKKLITTVSCLLIGTPVLAQAPEGFPSDYTKIIEAAKKEGSLVIYAPFDDHELRPVFDAYSSRYPGIKIEYNDLSTPVIFNRFLSETGAGGKSADFILSSAVDMQVKLVDDGFAAEYVPVEVAKYADELNMDNMAFTVMNEPICWIYNKALIPEEKRPRSHADLAEKLRSHPEVYKGKIVSYDIEKSGVGFFNVHNDMRIMGEDSFWDMAAAMQESGIRMLGSSGAMVEAVVSGEAVMAYNLTCGVPAYAQLKNDNIGIIYPEDFTTVAGRVAIIPDNAAAPNAAKLMLDLLLTVEGQEMMARTPGLFSSRTDVKAPGLDTSEIKDRLRPLDLSADLLFNFDQDKRLAFLTRWKKAFGG